MQPAKARVLYGYFENNTLKVVATKAHNFDVPNYREMMYSLVRWASPSIHGNTKTGLLLPLRNIAKIDRRTSKMESERANICRNAVQGF